MSKQVEFGVTPEPKWHPPRKEECRDSCVYRDANQRKRNLETLLWLGMEIDGSLGRAKRERPLRYCACRAKGRK